MKAFHLILATGLLFVAGCKKNGSNPPGGSVSKSYGPFTIYSEYPCNPDWYHVLVADYVSDKKIEATSGLNLEPENPEFWLRSTPEGYRIIYSFTTYVHDTTFWVWYDDGERNDNCSFSVAGCGSVKLKAFTKLDDVKGGEYNFRISVEDKTGKQESLIETSKSSFLYGGSGKQVNKNNTCNRGAFFLAASAACKTLYERPEDGPFEYCFTSRFFFVKK